MGSVGAGKNNQTALARPDEFNGLFGEREQDTSKEAVYDRLIAMQLGTVSVNPNYQRYMHNEYSTNCAICATAVSLQLDGYDVEAGPRDKDNWRGFDSVYDVDFTDTDNYILSSYKGIGNYRFSGMPKEEEVRNNIRASMKDESKIHKMPQGAGPASRAIENMVKTWGNGAYGQMSVRWKDTNSAHAVNIINKNGQVLIYDGQTNNTYTDIKKYLSRTIAGRTAIVRLDNAPKREDFNTDTLKKMFKKRKQ